MLPAVPSGRYFLRIEPDGDAKLGSISYQVTVTRGAPTFIWFLVAIPLLLVPAILATWRSIGFEHRRWQESDHAGPGISSGGGDDDDS